MNTFFIILIAIVLIYQSNKINKLEILMKSRNQNQSTTPPVVKSPEQNQNQTGPIPAQTDTIPTQTPVPSPAPAPVVNQPVVSSEESSGKILGRIGITAVVIGIAFFLKYAFDNNWVAPSGRVVIGILIGLAVLALGQWLRKKYLGFSDLLMGGGLVILYLSLLASYALYGLTDPIVTFMAMIVVTAIGVVMSITNATKTLSVISFVGGFITPSLIGVHELGTWITFTYLTILNLGILGILVYKKWSHLVVIGLICTWLYFGSWFVASYNDDLLIPTLFFATIQFLIFTGSSAIRIIVDRLKAVEIDYFVLTATAVSFASLCYALLIDQYKHTLSLGFVLVAVFYFAFALIAFRRNPEDRTLNIFLPGLAVAFLTVAIPVELSGPWITVFWLVEAVVLYVVALKSSSRGFQVVGAVVYILALIDLLYYIVSYIRPANYMIFFNGRFVMPIIATIVSFVIAFIYYRYGSVSVEIQKRGIMIFSVVANIILLYTLTAEIYTYYDLQILLQSSNSNSYVSLRNWSNTSVSIMWALYATLLTIIGFARRYPSVRRMGLVLFIITAVKVFFNVWSLGEIYRVISFIVFGIIALTASFLYVKYKDRLKEIV